jgi:hypothetical protein
MRFLRVMKASISAVVPQRLFACFIEAEMKMNILILPDSEDLSPTDFDGCLISHAPMLHGISDGFHTSI